MTTPISSECDITSSALSCGLAETALKHFNKVTPWGARKRSADAYNYVLRMNSRDDCHIWMRDRYTDESVMYLTFNEKVGALQSNDADKCHVSMLSESEIDCMQEARMRILEERLQEH